MEPLHGPSSLRTLLPLALVISPGGSAGPQDAPFSMSFHFMTSGTYPYFCTTHCGEKMTGAILVEGVEEHAGTPNPPRPEPR